jgi:signal transduction histidine kinase
MEMEFKSKNIPTDYIKMGKNILNGSIHLINDITYTKELSDGFVIQHKEELEVTPFISEMIQSFESTAKEKNISIVPAISTNGLSIEIDKIIMGRILQNIISNAIKFSPFEKKIFITASMTSNRLIVSVKDEGPGIAKEEQLLLFKRFQKLSARPTNKESSSGLGLYIVKTLADKIGAEIQVISDKGHGAEFKLLIPLKKN